MHCISCIVFAIVFLCRTLLKTVFLGIDTADKFHWELSLIYILEFGSYGGAVPDDIFFLCVCVCVFFF